MKLACTILQSDFCFFGENAVPLKCLLKPLISKTNMLALSSEPSVIRCKQLKQEENSSADTTWLFWERFPETRDMTRYGNHKTPLTKL